MRLKINKQAFFDPVSRCDLRTAKNENERQSAKLVREELQKFSLPAGEISKIEKIIPATEKHSAENPHADGKLFLDFDPAIPDAKNEVYDEYKNEILTEY